MTSDFKLDEIKALAALQKHREISTEQVANIKIPDFKSVMGWDEFFFRHVYLASSKSKDKSTHIGAILVRDHRVIAEGYNGFAEGVNDFVFERYLRPEKYLWTEHGERNAVYQCARLGIAAKNSVMYTNGVPCCDCARAVIQAGIKEVVVHKQWESYFEDNLRWKESCETSFTMLSEAGVAVRRFDQVLGIKTLLNEKIIEV